MTPAAEPRGAGTRRPEEAGVALVAVLWFVALMSGLALTFLEQGRESAHAGRNAVRALETRVAMAGAVEIAAQSIRAGRFPTDGALAWRQGRQRVRVLAMPESRKIDLNAANDDLIEGLAAAVVERNGGGPEAGLALGHAILDWRDADSERRLAGAEAGDYASDAAPRDGPFRFLAELRTVAGVDPVLFRAMAAAVTVHHGEATPPAALLPPLVQDALDRARGLDAGIDDFESSFDAAMQPLDTKTDKQGTLPFVQDPAGLYTLDIVLAHDDGPTFRQETVIWIDPPLESRHYAILEQRSSLLPPGVATALGAGDGSGAEPGRTTP